MDEGHTHTEESHGSNGGSGWAIALVVLLVVAIAGVALFKSSKNKQMNKVNDTPSSTTGNSMTGSNNNIPDSSENDVAPEDDSDTKVFTLEGGLFYFKPAEIKVKKGDRVRIVFNNVEGMHDFNIDELNVKTSIVPTGKSTQVEFTASKAGVFTYYCSVADHAQMGMKGTLTVE